MAELSLKVDSAYPVDQGYGRARLDPASMEALGVQAGDIVTVTGKRTTVAKVWKSQKGDWNQNKIRIDKYTRLNAGVEVSGVVRVQKIGEEIKAKEITIIPHDIDIPDQVFNRESFDLASLVNHPAVTGDVLPVSIHLMEAPFINFKVKSMFPENACLIGDATEYSVSNTVDFEIPKKVTYEDIGGLKRELNLVRETIELPIRHPELFEKLGIEPPKGVLLYGPPGTGKTLIAKAVANESGAEFYSIAGPEIISKYYGESEQKLREIFEEAEQNAPSIIFIDELDSIAPRREDVTGEVERRVVAQLLTMLDGISERGKVIVIGATNRPDAIDSALRRPGRFDREIEIGVPGEEDRLEILKIHTRHMPLKDLVVFNKKNKPTQKNAVKSAELYDKFLQPIASLSRGFVGADLAAIAQEAGIIALHRQLDEKELSGEKIPEEKLKDLVVTREDFFHALRKITPSAMREIALETADVSWHDIGGCHDALIEVSECVSSPLTDKSRFAELGIKPPKGVLLYGPPGTGKTLIAKAVANESGANFIAVKGPQLLSKWVGESERAVREMFKKARQVAPSVIFFDEIDSLTPSRNGDSNHVQESVLNQILTEMDGIEDLSDVVILAASNRPDIIDPALLRSGRFDRLVYIPEPSLEDRKQILQVHTRYMPLKGSILPALLNTLNGIDESEIERIAQKFQGKSVTVKQILAAAKDCEWNSSVDDLKNTLIRSFAKHHVTLTDPKRSAIIETIAKDTEGFVGADLEGLVREAAMHALREGRSVVTLQDFTDAREHVHATMNPHVREYYENIQKSFKGGLPKEAQGYIEYQ